MPDNSSIQGRPRPARLQHVVAHQASSNPDDPTPAYDEVVVFGQELDALRHTHGKTGWVYAAIPHGASFVDALEAAQA